MNQPELSIIIPVYNEDATIDRVVRRCLEVDLPVSREVIVVDDGSHDETQEVLLRSLGESDNVRIYAHGRNAGKGVALRTGLTNAHGRLVVVQDADLELDPCHIAALIQPLLDRAGRGDFRVSCGRDRTPRYATRPNIAATVLATGLRSRRSVPSAANQNRCPGRLCSPVPAGAGRTDTTV